MYHVYYISLYMILYFSSNVKKEKFKQYYNYVCAHVFYLVAIQTSPQKIPDDISCLLPC